MSPELGDWRNSIPSWEDRGYLLCMDAHNNPDTLSPSEIAAEKFGDSVGVIAFFVAWAVCLQFGLMGLLLGWIPGLFIGAIAGTIVGIIRLYWWQIPLFILVAWLLVSLENQNIEQGRIPAAQSTPSQPLHAAH